MPDDIINSFMNGPDEQGRFGMLMILKMCPLPRPRWWEILVAVGMLAGILKVRSTGVGCVVDAAMIDGSAHMMNLIMSMRAEGEFQTQRGQSVLDGPHWS